MQCKEIRRLGLTRNDEKWGLPAVLKNLVLVKVEFAEDNFQAIDLDGTTNNCSSGRRPWDAFSNWRTRTAGTGRLNR